MAIPWELKRLSCDLDCSNLSPSWISWPLAVLSQGGNAPIEEVTHPPPPPILYQRLPYSLKAFLLTHTKMRIMEILNFSLFCHTDLFVIQPRCASILSFSCFILNKISDRNLWSLSVCSVRGVAALKIKTKITADIRIWQGQHRSLFLLVFP